MNILRVAVADDDPAVGKIIREWIKGADPEADVHLFESAEAILLSGHPFDIVFMDIRMEGTDGIEAVRRLSAVHRSTLFIFVSVLRELVFDALDVHPFHFLVKPLDRRNLLRVFSDARAVVREQHHQRGGRLIVTNRGQSICVPHAEILYIERSARKLEVHTQHQVYAIYGALDRIEQQLDSSFYRCHRAVLVNFAWIRSYRSDRILLENGESVDLARKKHSDFVRQYMWYLNLNGNGTAL